MLKYIFMLLVVSTTLFSQTFLPENRKGDWDEVGYLHLDMKPTETKFLNVLDYGVTNDGNDINNNNATKIMEALEDIDPSGYTTLFFPEGDYLISSMLDFSGHSNFAIKGEAAEKTTFIFDLNNEDDKWSFMFANSENNGLENLYVTRADSAETGRNILFINVNGGYVYGVGSQKPIAVHLEISESNNIEVTNSVFYEAYHYGEGGQGYGVVLTSNSEKCLVHNNILYHLRHATILGTGARNNVISYNYMFDPFTTQLVLGAHDWCADMSIHGDSQQTNNPPEKNLFEGNIGSFMHADNAWGPNDPYNTFFRNRATYYGVKIEVQTEEQNVIANEVDDSDNMIDDFLINAFSLDLTTNFVVGNINFDPDPAQYPDEYSGDLSLYLDVDNLPTYLDTLEYFPPIGAVDEEHLGGGLTPAKMRHETDIYFANRPPVFTSISPADMTTHFPTGDEVMFEVETSDPEGSDITYQWFVDGSPVTFSGSSFPFTPVTSNHTITVIANDGNDTSSNTWTCSFTSIGDEPIANDYKLNQLYPNPFNPELKITLNSPEDAYIVIYDISGRKVDKFKVNGNSLTWKGKDSAGKVVSSGVYLINLVSNNKILDVKPVILNK